MNNKQQNKAVQPKHTNKFMPSDYYTHHFWIQRVHQEGNGKLRSLSKGLNLGFLNQIPLQDCEEWVEPKDIKEDQPGQFTLNKKQALRKLEGRLYSPKGRHSQSNSMMIQQYNTSNGIKDGNLGADLDIGNKNIEKSMIVLPSKYEALTLYDTTKLNDQKNQTKRSISPTYAQTTNNPPYGNYPRANEQIHLARTQRIKNISGMNKGYYLRLSKKCYIGNELDEMPWAKSQIDLSFPEIKKVKLDMPQKPQIDPYYPLAYQRMQSDMKIDKDDLKIQNKAIKTINVIENIEQYRLNKQEAQTRQVKQITSQISLAGDYQPRDLTPVRSTQYGETASQIRLNLNQNSQQRNISGIQLSNNQESIRSQSVLPQRKDKAQLLIQNQEYNDSNNPTSTQKHHYQQEQLSALVDNPEQPYLHSGNTQSKTSRNIGIDNSTKLMAQAKMKTQLLGINKIAKDDLTAKSQSKERAIKDLKLKTSKNKRYLVPDMTDAETMRESIKRVREMISGQKNQGKTNNINKNVLNAANQINQV